jgi:hypothetical protein
MKNAAWNLEAWQQINELVGQYFVHSSGPFGVSLRLQGSEFSKIPQFVGAADVWKVLYRHT